jgi:uncharacterized small protein (DUF1192 family)
MGVGSHSHIHGRIALLRKESNGVAVDLNPWPTMREAADEIERLRAEIVRLEAKKQ